VPATNEPSLCKDFFKRGDRVPVTTSDGGSDTVTIANSPPKVTEVSTVPDNWQGGTAIEVTPLAEDADGDEVEFQYKWVINGVEDPLLNEAVLPAGRSRRGDRIEVRITPSDGREEGPVYVSVGKSVAGSAPEIVSRPAAWFESKIYSYQVVAKDLDNDQLTFSLDNPPEGMTIDAKTGLVSWSLTGIAPGKYPIKVVVRDPDGGEDSQEFELVLGGQKPVEPEKP
jgi:hypothetical protein